VRHEKRVVGLASPGIGIALPPHQKETNIGTSIAKAVAANGRTSAKKLPQRPSQSAPFIVVDDGTPTAF